MARQVDEEYPEVLPRTYTSPASRQSASERSSLGIDEGTSVLCRTGAILLPVPINPHWDFCQQNIKVTYNLMQFYCV